MSEHLSPMKCDTELTKRMRVDYALNEQMIMHLKKQNVL